MVKSVKTVHIKMTRGLNLLIFFLIKNFQMTFLLIFGRRKNENFSEPLTPVKPSKIQRVDLSYENKQ